MKNLKLKGLLMVGMMSAGIFGSSFANAGEDDKIKLDGNRFENRKELNDMQKTLSRIEKDQARIDFYKKELKANKKADKKIPAHMSKKELRKAKADLKRDKKYLKVDKRDLKKDQRVAIREARKAERQASHDLFCAKRELRKDLRRDHFNELEADLKVIKKLTQKVEAMENETASLERDVDEVFDYIEQEIDEVV